jgi:trk system potassium uptake protein TrkH
MGVIERSFSKWTPTQILIATFALLILVGSSLLSLPIASNTGRLSYLDALFTATSAVCVTGLVVVDTLTQFSFFGQVVIIVLIQFGGLGLMTMATMMAIFLGRKISFRNRLIMQEALNQFSLAGLVRLTMAVGVVTAFLEGLGAIILTIRFLPEHGFPTAVWYGIFHAISAFCNAGFDLIGQFRSLTLYTSDWVINLVVTTLIIFGGLGFSVIVDLFQHRHGFKFSRLSLHSKIVIWTSVLLIISGMIFLLALEWNGTLAGLPMHGKLLGAYFQSVTPRTAGFNTLPIDQMRSASILMIIIFMFIGASPGSTGGGIKTSTFSALVLMVAATVKGRDDARIFDREIPREIVLRAMAIAAIALSLVIGVTMLLSLTENQPFLSVLFETVSAFGTVGLSLGITPTLSHIGRLAIIFTMFAGRVGPMTLALAVAQSKNPAAIRYPEEKIIVG